MSFLFNKEKSNDGVEKVGFGEVFNEERTVIRKITFRILNTSIIYNTEEDDYETLATCINEHNEIETISIEAFKVDEKVTEFRGAYIDYTEIEGDFDVECTGRIYNL
jgi:nanoRNase/pAp phosphatase (c-di-AMP/oligoRNAs hydrolase)